MGTIWRLLHCPELVSSNKGPNPDQVRPLSASALMHSGDSQRGDGLDIHFLHVRSRHPNSVQISAPTDVS